MATIAVQLYWGGGDGPVMGSDGNVYRMYRGSGQCDQYDPTGTTLQQRISLQAPDGAAQPPPPSNGFSGFGHADNSSFGSGCGTSVNDSSGPITIMVLTT